MAKQAKPKKTAEKSALKSPSAYSSTDAEALTPSEDNDSKYQPTEDADMDEQSLDPGDGLLKLFTDSIKDLYWAENHLVKALPKLAKAASLTSLQSAIEKHLEETKTHVDRLDQVFEALGKKPQAKKCDAMEGLTKEAEGVIEDTDSGTPARDLGIIMAGQKTEHYEISAYKGLTKLAISLGLTDIADILSQTLAEEENADETLSGIPDNDIQYDDSDSNE